MGQERLPNEFIAVIKDLPILDVLAAYGKDEHAIKMDKSFTVYPKKNSWHDFNGSGGGNGIAYVMDIVGERSFIEAVKSIGEKFDISPDSFSEEADYSQATVRAIPEKRKVNFEIFNGAEKKFTLDLSSSLKDYSSFSPNQRQRILYTLFFECSRFPEQLKKRDDYFKNTRGLPSENTYLRRAGYMDKDTLKYTVNMFRDLCENEKMGKMITQDLVESGLMIEKMGVVSFRHPLNKDVESSGMVLFPSISIRSSNEIVGFMARLTHPTAYQLKNGQKEVRVSIPLKVNSEDKALSPFYPIGCDYDTLKSSSTVIVPEGPIDGGGFNNLPSDTAVFASPGTGGIGLEMCGVFKGKDVIIAFDQDSAGLEAAHGSVTLYAEKSGEEKESFVFLQNKKGLIELKEKRTALAQKGFETDTLYKEGLKGRAEKAGAKSAKVLEWDTEMGSDINEVYKNGNMKYVYPTPTKQSRPIGMKI